MYHEEEVCGEAQYPQAVEGRRRSVSRMVKVISLMFMTGPHIVEHVGKRRWIGQDSPPGMERMRDLESMVQVSRTCNADHGKVTGSTLRIEERVCNMRDV